MRLRLEHLYFGLAALGLVATWYFNLQYFAGGGSVAPGPFFASALANPLATAITVDVYWAALVFSVWALAERQHACSPPAWRYIVLCFAIGLAFAFPLYLGRRQQLTRRMVTVDTPDGSCRPAPFATRTDSRVVTRSKIPR